MMDIVGHCSNFSDAVLQYLRSNLTQRENNNMDVLIELQLTLLDFVDVCAIQWGNLQHIYHIIKGV